MNHSPLLPALIASLLLSSVRASPETPPPGFVPIFDGKTWTGWNRPTSPNYGWEIRDGCLCLRADQRHQGKGDPNLSTTRRFRDFVLLVDWRLTRPPQKKGLILLTEDGLYRTDAAGVPIRRELPFWGDSGIFLRGARAAQVNIWCEPCGSGEVGQKYKDMAAPLAERIKTMPKVRADKGPGEWNHFEITLRGNRVDVALNGVQVIEDARVRAKDLVPEGPITLQNHDDPVEFRHFYLRELPGQ